MKISAKTDYAYRALLELALHWPNIEPLQVRTIAERQKIPVKFLIHILIHLKELGFVDSIRGKKGGYVLAKSPQEIRLSDLAKPFMELGTQNQSVGAKTKANNVFVNIWQNIDELILEQMNKITFEEVCRKERNLMKVQMYTI